MLVDLWRRGQLNIADAVTNRYPLAQVSQGYQDLEDGKTSAASSCTRTPPDTQPPVAFQK